MPRSFWKKNTSPDRPSITLFASEPSVWAAMMRLLALWAITSDLVAFFTSAQYALRIHSEFLHANIPGATSLILDMRGQAFTDYNLSHSNGVAFIDHWGFSRLGCADPTVVPNHGGEPCVVDDETVFGIGSASSLLVASAVMKSQQRGHVSLDEPISTYLESRSTELLSRKLPSVFKFNDPMGMLRRVTLRQLLSHSGCLTDSALIQRTLTRIGDSQVLLAAFIREQVQQAINWRPGCVLGSSYHYSSLGISLAAHVLEYGDPAVELDFIKYAKGQMLSELGMGNAGWKRSHLVQHGALAYPYSSFEDFPTAQARISALYPLIQPEPIQRAELQLLENICSYTFAAINGTNATTDVFNCSTTLPLLTREPEKGNTVVSLGYYSKVDAPSSNFRASALDVAKFLAMHMDEGVATSGQQYLNYSQIDEMRLPHLPIDDGSLKTAVGLGWHWDSYDGRELLTIDAGHTNPGMSSLISFDPETNIGVVILANGDMSKFTDGKPMQTISKTSVEEALVTVRDYLFDTWEYRYVPDSLPPPVFITSMRGFNETYPQIPVNGSHSYTPLGTRLGTGFPVVEFKIFNITATSVSWTVEYENLNAEAGDYIKVAHGSREQTFFPQQAVLPVQAEYPDYVGEPYQDQTAREIQVVSTSVDDGEIRGEPSITFFGFGSTFDPLWLDQRRYILFELPR